MIELISKSVEETKEIACAIGSKAPPGTVFVLSGELGAGKTAFAQGLATGLGITERVASPTFNIAQTYDSGRLPFAHLDAYRLEGSNIYEMGLEEYWQQNGVTAIEWGEVLSPILPQDAIFISLFNEQNIDKHEQTSACANWRRIVFYVVMDKFPWLEEVINCIS